MYDPPEHDTKPAPVEVKHAGPVLTHGRRPTSTTVEAIPCGVQGQAVRILGNNPNRCVAHLRAVAGDVLIGPASGTGFLLASGDTTPLTVRATEALYATPAAGADPATTVHVFSEHYDG